jgi:hypothetical protein
MEHFYIIMEHFYIIMEHFYIIMEHFYIIMERFYIIMERFYIIMERVYCERGDICMQVINVLVSTFIAGLMKARNLESKHVAVNKIDENWCCVCLI